MYGMFGIPNTSSADIQTFSGNSAAAGVTWHTWYKRPGVSMVSIFMVGGGGGGGNSVLGAASTAAGGGGGGSASQTMLTIPAFMLPDELFVSAGIGGASAAAGTASYVSVSPTSTANYVVALANGGGAGGTAAGATAGAAGAAGTIAAIGSMPLGGMGNYAFLAGQAGIIGGTTVSGAALTLPVTGLVVTGGTGGGGLPALSTGGTSGGSFTVPATAGGFQFPAQAGGAGGAINDNPGFNGSNGFQVAAKFGYYYGGTGGGSAGLGAAGTVADNGGNGGNGSFGCGGGGGGGGFTGATAGAAIGGRGGPGLVLIISW